MKKVGIILLGIGFGIVCYIIFSLLFHEKEIVSPIEEADTNRIIRQNTK